MNLRSWLVVGLLVATPAIASSSTGAAESAVGVSLQNSSHKATLLRGATLDAPFTAGAMPSVGMLEALRFTLAGDLTLDTGGAFGGGDRGGGVDAGLRPILALLLGLLIGFGLGHLVARDRDGFVLFLIVDLVIVLLWSSSAFILTGIPFIWNLGWIAKVISQIIQGLDAYAKAGGGRLVEWTRERSVEIASAKSPGSGDALPVTFRALGFSF